MKNYHQLNISGYSLPKSIYRKCVNDIKCYNTYRNVIEGILNRSKSKLNPEEAALNKEIASSNKRVIDIILQQIPEEYRVAIFEHLINNQKIDDVAYKYNLSPNKIKEYKQKYIYLYAKEKGINFFKE